MKSTVFSKPTGLSDDQGDDNIIERISLVQELIDSDKRCVVLNFTESNITVEMPIYDIDKAASEVDVRFDQFEHLVFLINGLNSQVIDYIKSVDTDQVVSVIALESVDLGLKADIVSIDNFVVTSTGHVIESEKLIPISKDTIDIQNIDSSIDLKSEHLLESEKSYFQITFE
ncbi:hypothetical protein CANTEDRAFT_94348 [Yamadazyma tenuis ATCC 10573]|uniref:Uncharacterized protein n=2 Tax=Candida tenuis TaxID=2315449 RepID=G3BAN7_CANTC|nr:uncharacterized protein CANTEDRAFT_94348 [Yamadazyma tenuis ATCC 10573]EGV61455.1 hypothetical protein CANTEDRAFT_94348 [Yamadazyma tenuis ATCC 10573]